MHKIEKVIISSNISKDYQKNIITESGRKEVFGVLTQPFDAVFYDVKENKDYDLMQYYNSLLKHQDKLKPYIFSYKNFNKIVKLAKTLQEYGVELDKDDFTQEKDIQILNAIELMGIEIKKVDQKDYKYVSQNLNDSQIHYLQKLGLYEIELQNHHALPHQIHYYKTMNPIQSYYHVLSNLDFKEEKTLILSPNKEADLALLKNACERLNIPYESDTSHYNLSKANFLSLLNFYIVKLKSKDETSGVTDDDVKRQLILLLKSNYIEIKHADLIIKHIEYYNITLEDILNKQFPRNKNQDEKTHHLLISSLEDLLEKLDAIYNHEDVSDVVESIFNEVNNRDSKGSSIIKSLLQNVMPLIHEGNLDFLYEHVKGLNTFHFQSPYFDFDSYDNVPLYTKENIIIMGLTNDTFPMIHQEMGLIDESFLENLSHKKYPSLESRIEKMMQDKKRIFFSAHHNLTIYTHELDLEGSTTQEINLAEIFDAYHNASKDDKTILQIPNDPKIIENLEIAHSDTKSNVQNIEDFRELLEGELKLSPSKLSAYIQDPKKFINEHIIQIHKNDDYPGFSLFLGTLNHKILQKYLPESSDPKALFTYENYVFEIEELLEIEEISHAPIYRYLLEINYKYIHAFLNQVYRNLSEEKVHYTTSILAREKKLESTINFEDGGQVVLKGVVDRIDLINENLIRVIDYKTSVKKQITAKKFKYDKTLNYLQIIAYMWMASEKYHVDIQSGYLQKIMPEKKDQQNIKLTKKEFKPLDLSNKNNFNFDKLDILDDTSKISKDFKTYFETVIETLYDFIMNAETDTTVIEPKLKCIYEKFKEGEYNAEKED